MRQDDGSTAYPPRPQNQQVALFRQNESLTQATSSPVYRNKARSALYKCYRSDGASDRETVQKATREVRVASIFQHIQTY